MRQRLGLLAPVVGLVLGIALGLVYAWVINPVELYNTTPALLRTDYQHEWIRMVALGYTVDGDLERALARLEGLDDEEIDAALSAMIETYASQGRPAGTMRALSSLAQHLGINTSAMSIYLSTPASPSPPPPSPSPLPATPLASPSPTPALDPTPTVVSPFTPSHYRVVSQTLVCEGTPSQLAIWVQTRPAELELELEEDEEPPQPTQLPGVVLWLTWPGGADRAVTGLQPQLGPGYADFTLEPGVPYALSIGEPNAPLLSGFTVQFCPAEGEAEPQPGSWWLVIEGGE